LDRKIATITTFFYKRRGCHQSDANNTLFLGHIITRSTSTCMSDVSFVECVGPD